MVIIITILLAANFFTLVHRFSSALALFSGVVLAVAIANPFEKYTKKLATILLPLSIIGLGFRIDLATIMHVGITGFGYTVFSICFCLLLGLMLGKIFKNRLNTSLLITCGTAICGGSAIAALTPTIRAKDHEASVAFAVVFMLNALALVIFPIVGNYFHLTQGQFGLWSALAIHDTSSVVGASMQYGAEALKIATTVKLARALWIIPITVLVSVAFSLLYKKDNEKKIAIKKPWFIPGFVMASAFITWAPTNVNITSYLNVITENLFILSLFCIGSNLSIASLKKVGVRPFLQGWLLWVITAITMLVVVVIIVD